ncbi:MAG: DUF4287 domain-containing protein [Phycicoccus sp.]
MSGVAREATPCPRRRRPAGDPDRQELHRIRVRHPRPDQRLATAPRDPSPQPPHRHATRTLRTRRRACERGGRPCAASLFWPWRIGPVTAVALVLTTTQRGHWRGNLSEAFSLGRGRRRELNIISWLADEYGLGRGHAVAVVHVVKNRPQIADTHVGTSGSHHDESDTLRLDGVANRDRSERAT